MQTMTSAYANKMLKSLEEDKAFWVNKEATSSTYVAAINEEPVVPEYDYTEVVATITSLDEKIAIIKHVTLDKRSKKAQREYYAKQRTTWGELNPVTRSVPSGKAYNRKKEKQRIGVEFRNGFDADFLRSLVLFIHFRTSESE